ncbi:hypothetical protein CEXT_451471 [Caerostris extrusa]|uniref:Uncharacterized protein n=1 Tax=Caerostris extrusa TaxID=172846 RepID=A0AAV4MBR1_CAEEX|nr:hypothetical protein CEXT_451471 [Caerostris extrusa]
MVMEKRTIQANDECEVTYKLDFYSNRSNEVMQKFWPTLSDEICKLLARTVLLFLIVFLMSGPDHLPNYKELRASPI